jgi:hypothetical protein
LAVIATLAFEEVRELFGRLHTSTIGLTP